MRCRNSVRRRTDLLIPLYSSKIVDGTFCFILPIDQAKGDRTKLANVNGYAKVDKYRQPSRTGPLIP